MSETGCAKHGYTNNLYCPACDRESVSADQRFSTEMLRLQAAISRVKDYQALPLIAQLKAAQGFAVAEREAWRAAFEWRNRTSVERGEIDEGMKMIWETL